MKRLRAAVIGTGFVGRLHIEALRGLGNVEVKIVGVSRKEKAARTAAELGVDQATADLREIFDDTAIDAIHVCTPNSLHLLMAKAALEAGKHVICEKPLATSADEARDLTDLAAQVKRRNCTFHNLRYYPLVQQMRAMCAAGELGDILIVRGEYLQDWLLHDTDWNWGLDPNANGPSRCLADIGSHWCDMAEHVTGLRITGLCADLETFHESRRRPKGAVETFASKNRGPASYEDVAVETEDYGAVVFHMGRRTRGSFTAAQVCGGRKNGLRMEIYGSKASVAWNQERPEELWLGHRDQPNGVMLKDPSLLADGARGFADLPGGHGEGYTDTFKQLFRRFYHAVSDPGAEPEYPQFADGLRQLVIVEAELASHARRTWVDVPAPAGGS